MTRNRFATALRNPRPPSRRYSVVWFPTFLQNTVIENFRQTHDPLAKVAPTHIHLVYPFATALTATQITTHVKRVVKNWPVIPASFRWPEILLDEYILLPAKLGQAALTELHDQLYTGILKPHLRNDIDYKAHLTMGRVKRANVRPFAVTVEEHQLRAEAARLVLQEAEIRLREEQHAVLRELAIVEHLNEHQSTAKIIIKSTVPLNWA
jgi:2'-5' RNA ligase